MMEKTIGKKLYELRKQSGFTQDYVAEKLGVSAQAVSKWENDIACPDIMTLPNIANLYGISIDELFKNEEVKSNVKFEKTEKINENELIFRVYVDTVHGDDIKVNLPYLLVKEIINVGKNISGVVAGVDLSSVDFESIFKMVEMGVLGELVTVKTQNGDNVRVAAGCSLAAGQAMTAWNGISFTLQGCGKNLCQRPFAGTFRSAEQIAVGAAACLKRGGKPPLQVRISQETGKFHKQPLSIQSFAHFYPY